MSYEFPIKDFESKAKKLKWYLINSHECGFYCESCLQHEYEKFVLVSIVDKDLKEGIVGRVLPCCLECGLKYNLIDPKKISNANKIVKEDEIEWDKQLKPLKEFGQQVTKIVMDKFFHIK